MDPTRSTATWCWCKEKLKAIQKETEGRSSVVKFRLVLLQSAAVEICAAYTLSYLVVLGRREVSVSLILESLILCCQGSIIKQTFILHLSAKCMVDLALEICYCLLLRMFVSISGSSVTISSTNFPEGL